ncbi:MAG: hypothetical protein MI824_19105 [Hyphomicrobiales bacterium]|nr:hypothetical protein [Hyphomicrobiales bacterium]
MTQRTIVQALARDREAVFDRKGPKRQRAWCRTTVWLTPQQDEILNELLVEFAKYGAHVTKADLVRLAVKALHNKITPAPSPSHGNEGPYGQLPFTNHKETPHS